MHDREEKKWLLAKGTRLEGKVSERKWKVDKKQSIFIYDKGTQNNSNYGSYGDVK